MKKTFLFLMVVSVFLTLPSTSFAVLNFKMTCDDPIIGIGEQTTIDIHVWDTDAVADYGIILWQFDMGPSADGIVSADTWAVEPWFIYESGYGPDSLNSPTSGNVNAFYALASEFDQVSNIGVGDYTKIASVTIEGLAEGLITYDLGDLTTLGFYGTVRGSFDQNSGVLDTGNSVLSYQVVPEPASIFLLGGMGLSLLRRRK